MSISKETNKQQKRAKTMSNDYKIEINQEFVILADDAKLCTGAITNINDECDNTKGLVVVSVIGNSIEEAINNNKDVRLITVKGVRYKVSDVLESEDKEVFSDDNSLYQFNAQFVLSEEQHPTQQVADDSYMTYKCPTQEDINAFLIDAGSELPQVPEGDSIYGLFFALFKEQEKRISELEKALIVMSNANTSH